MINDQSEKSFPTDPTVIVGVVHPHGSCGFGELTFLSSFETWRDENGVLHSEKLRLERQVTRDELEWFFERIQAYQILSVRVVFTSATSAKLIELLEQSVTPDEALVQRAAELQKPQTYKHERFGTFTLDRSMDCYEAATLWNGKEICLRLPAIDDSEVEAVLPVAIALWNAQDEWNERIQDYAVQELLDSVWHEDDETILTPDDFKSRMYLDSITVYPGGEFDFSHSSDDLFSDHWIQIDGNLRDGPTRASIQG